jgi:UDP-3-O-[3-hydroxymyristoyl] glucosamine N-acyltransferase
MVKYLKGGIYYLYMKTILLLNILDFLEEEGVSYKIKNHRIEDKFIVASIFNPIEHGVYFLVGETVPETLCNSLLLVKKDFPEEKIKDGNVGLFMDADPQLYFYKLLAKYFAVHSNGEVSALAIVHPEAIIGKGVQIDPFAIIWKAIIGDHSIIKSHCYIHDDSNIGANVVVDTHSVIGAQGIAWIWNEDETAKMVQPQLGSVIIKDHCFLGANTIVVRGSLNESSIVGHNTLLAPGCRIGHGTQIGNFVHLANNVITGGNTQIGDYCFIGSSAVFRPKVKLHNYTIVGTGAVVIKNTTEDGKTLMGVPASENETKVTPSGMPKPIKNKSNDIKNS